MSRINYGMRVTTENVEHIISHVQEFQMNVDHLKDTLEYHAEDGDDLYIVVSCDEDNGIMTVTEFIKPDFFSNWLFRHPENITTPWLQIIDRNL